MPITVTGCAFPRGNGIVDAFSYAFLSFANNFIIGVGTQAGRLRNAIIERRVGDANASGVVTIGGLATTATVKFATIESDAAYRICLGVANASQPAAVRTPYVFALSTSGFTIGLSRSMGVGQSCDVFWQLTR